MRYLNPDLVEKENLNQRGEVRERVEAKQFAQLGTTALGYSVWGDAALGHRVRTRESMGLPMRAMHDNPRAGTNDQNYTTLGLNE